jgi:decaprenylphospho-beta-D-erythro-pentofuranosid-2-ulose 2-reductase
MIDATGMPQTAVLVGGTSEIGLSVLKALAARRLDSVVLAGRDAEGLAAAALELEGAGVARVVAEKVDLSDPAAVDGLEGLVERCERALGGIDLVLVSTGDLGTASLAELTPHRVYRMFEANATGPAAAIVAFAKRLAAAGAGRIVVLSSVAGVRVRKANFVYGAGKAAVDGLSLGLADALEGTGVGVTVVRPGFVRTRMTTGMAAAPFAVDAADVAHAVVRGLETGAPVVWVPPVLRYVFVLLRLLPRAVFRRLPG